MLASPSLPYNIQVLFDYGNNRVYQSYLFINECTVQRTHSDQDTTKIRSHITTELITHRGTITDHFNKV